MNEAEAAMLRYFLSTVAQDALDMLHPDFQRFRTELLYKLPSGGTAR